MAHRVPGLKKRKAPRTAFKKGQPRPANAGRKKGTPNKFTRDIKEALLNAFNSVGGETYLTARARRDPRSFLGLLGKLLPTQVTGKDGGPIDLLVQRAQGNLANLSQTELDQLSKLLTKAGLTEIPS